MNECRREESELMNLFTVAVFSCVKLFSPLQKCPKITAEVGTDIILYFEGDSRA